MSYTAKTLSLLPKGPTFVWPESRVSWWRDSLCGPWTSGWRCWWRLASRLLYATKGRRSKWRPRFTSFKRPLTVPWGMLQVNMLWHLHCVALPSSQSFEYYSKIQHESDEQYCSFLFNGCRTFRAMSLCQLFDDKEPRLEMSCTHWIRSCSIAHQIHVVSTNAAMILYGITTHRYLKSFH